MTDTRHSRRKLLKIIAAGSGAVAAGKSLPESWSRPVVDAVMLPARAETTDESISDPTTTVAPTTTPDPCCLTAGTYCWMSTGDFYAMIEINVQESGLVTVTLVLDGSASETDTVPCQGGTFSVTISLYQSDHIIDGEITCGAQSVSGNYSIWGGQNTGSYTATGSACQTPV